MRLPVLSLSDEQLDELATGRPGPAALRILRAGQASKRRLLLRELAARATSEVSQAITLLDRAAARTPVAVAELLATPLLNASMIRGLQRIRHPDVVDEGATVAADTLGPVAAAAGLRAGLTFELGLASPGGSVWLPGLGTAHGLGSDRVVVRGEPSGFSVTGADGTVSPGAGDGWRPVRAITLAPSDPWAIEIADQDPVRDCFGHEPTGYLDDASFATLTGLLCQAWRLMTTDHPDRATAVRMSLSSIVPLATPPADEAIGTDVISASSRLAYGCVATSCPPDAATLVMILIHETQHMLLGGVLDLVDLYRDGGDAVFHAPWRYDPRPVGALLQGAYAHQGVTDFWRVHRQREPADTPARARAEFEFAYWRLVTARAVETLGNSGELTPAGERFVAGMADTARHSSAVAIPPAIAAAARDAADADAVRWRITNHDPAPQVISGLRQLLRAGAPCGMVDHPPLRPRPVSPARRRGLSASIRDRVSCGGQRPRDATPASGDQAFMDGDALAASRAFRDRISADPADDDAWVGLTVALGQLGSEPAATVLSRRPDLVQALYREERDDGGAQALSRTPDDIAVWLASGLGSPERA